MSALLIQATGCLLLMTLVHFRGSESSFPVDKVFHHVSLWSQDLGNGWRRNFVIGQRSDDVMTSQDQSPSGSIVKMRTITCLKSFDHRKYMVKIETKKKGKPHSNKVMYGCVRFKALSSQVARRSLTKPITDKHKVNCETDQYKEEGTVMIAYNEMTPSACPFYGGFQLRLHQGIRIAAHCLDSITGYNPRLDFACNSKGRVMADFGPDCVPNVSAIAVEKTFAHLQCVGSWKESGWKEYKQAVLLQDVTNRNQFWCMHYDTVKNTDEEIFQFYLSFDGMCSKKDYDSETREDLFGRMAKYIAHTNERCVQQSYIQNCQNNPEKCFDSHVCPSYCKRCNEEISTKNCHFKENIVGNWASDDNKHDVILDVKEEGFRLADYGTFSCFDTETSDEEGDNILSVVESKPESSCLPFYACARLSSPALGVLEFSLRPAKRDRDHGTPLSCVNERHSYGSLVPEPKKDTITLLNKEILQRVPCNIPGDMKFQTMHSGCRFSLKKCVGDCDKLHGDYDESTCGGVTKLNLDHEHWCHASFTLQDSVRAIITSSVQNEYKSCWIFSSSRVFVTVVEHCNSAGASRIFQDVNAPRDFDPFKAIASPTTGQSLSGNDDDDDDDNEATPAAIADTTATTTIDGDDEDDHENDPDTSSKHQVQTILLFASLCLFQLCVFVFTRN